MKIAEGRVLVDFNVLIYTTLEGDPRFVRSRDLLLARGGGERFLSAQNLAQMYPNLTGPKMEHPDPPSVARAKITSIALHLCEKHGITRQRYFDAQIAATMIAHGIRTLVTENTQDFKGITEIRAVDPFGK